MTIPKRTSREKEKPGPFYFQERREEGDAPPRPSLASLRPQVKSRVDGKVTKGHTPS